jgi:peptidoglycan hydrolase CwlO-like protein
MFGLVLGGLSISSYAFAKDISDEQYQVRMAQKEYDSATRDYETLTGQIDQVEKRAAQLNAQLDALKKSLPAKQTRLDKAKTDLDDKTKILDKVWEENKKR